MNALLFILLITVVIEIITLIGRFGFNISTKKIWLNTMHRFRLNHWFHFHHIFLGIIIILIALMNHNQFFIAFGIGLALSDIVHHLLLTSLIGNPEFHIIYKKSNEANGRNKLHKHLIHTTSQQSIQK